MGTGRRSGWPVVLAYCLVGAANQMVWLTYAPVTTVAAGRLGVSETAVGWLANLFPLLYLPIAVPAGLALDRWFRPTLMAGAVLTAVGASVRLVDETYAWALLGQVLVAVAQPFVLNAVTSVTGHYLEEEDRPKGIALATAATFAGFVLAFVLGAVLSTGDQLRTLVLVGALVATAGAAALGLALRRAPVAGRAASGRVEWSQVRVTLSDPVLRRLVVVVAFPFGTFVALSTWGQALLEPAGVDADTASLMLLLTVVLGVAGCAVVRVLAAQRHAEVATMAGVLVVSGVACVVLALVPGVLTGFVGLGLVGLALLPAIPIVLEIVERRAGAAEGTAAGLVWLSGNLGGLVVAGVVGLLLDVPALGFLVCAVASFAAVPLVRGLRRKVPREPHDERPAPAR
jgi:predicted MFS family arabinose efflux permease